ncbi:Cell wall alpha-1,3-glucan synthase mok13 [Venturia inaequalis]|nr:Cell wall alpha-1,3-glucan synthase mok13 [Venturia inaequalis]
MVSSVVNVAFGNSKNVIIAASYPAHRLTTYSKSAEIKLNAMDGGSSNGSEHAGTAAVDTIRFETAEGILPHPLKGYPESYKGHKRLTVDRARRLGGRPISFSTLLRIQEALLLLAPKNHLGRQFDIRNAIMDHLSTKPLTPDELYKVGMIFTNETTADAKLVNYAANKTVDLMEAGYENGSMSTETYWTLMKVSAAIPVLKEKMDNAYAGKKARKEREVAKSAQAAEWEARREARNRERATRESAKHIVEDKKGKRWENFQEASAGRRTISPEYAGKLMTGPVIFMGELAKEV